MIEDGPNWYYCIKHKHWRTDRPELDRGLPTGFNKGEKDCRKSTKFFELKESMREIAI